MSHDYSGHENKHSASWLGKGHEDNTCQGGRALRTRRGHFLVSMCLVLFGTMAQTMAQAPASIAGKGFGMTITAGTYPFASSGFYAFAPASSGNTYQLIGFQNVADSSGTYAYSTAGAIGQASLNDSAGPIVCKLTFTNAMSGFYLVTSTLYGVSQNGTFLMFTNPTPSSISDRKSVV